MRERGVMERWGEGWRKVGGKINGRINDVGRNV